MTEGVEVYNQQLASDGLFANSPENLLAQVPQENFLERANREGDSTLATDLRFSYKIAEAIRDSGGRALAVGGYARDVAITALCGQEQISKDIDIEVYGLGFDSLHEHLNGFGKVDLVGASFGIAKVTNPNTGSIIDFSIPRQDSKVDVGHRGFQITGDPDMTVREAARRRDLTINALAIDPLTGEMIDEYGGLQDVKDRILRATDANLFTDDPLRVLRVMQFAGRFNFIVADETVDLCHGLDLTEVSAERIGEEWIKLMAKSYRPSVGLEVARELGVLDQLHPELAILDKIEQEPEWHPEGNVWNHTKHTVDAAARVVRDEKLQGDEALIVLFGALCHDLGKVTTTELREKQGVMRITAHGHEAAGVEPSRSFLTSLKMKHKVIDTILPVVQYHLYHVHVPNPTDKQLQRFAQRLQPASIRLWDLVSRCDSNGRGLEFNPETPSHAIYRRSLELKVAEQPAPPIVKGRDLIGLGLQPGPRFKTILDFLYDAQLGGEITSVDEGLALYLRHQDTLN